MEETLLIAQPRNQFGTRASRRLRQEGLLPANLYGQKEENISLSLDAKAFTKILREGHRIVKIQVGEKVEQGLVKEVQYDAYGSVIVHVDITRVRSDQAIEVSVPIETFGVAKGLTSGGVLSFPVQELLVSCLPGDVPDHYRINIEALEIGQVIRLKELTPPPKCTFLGDPEMAIIGVMQKREEVVAAAPAEAGPVQPEVIGKKKEEEAEEPAAGGKEGKKEKDKEK